MPARLSIFALLVFPVAAVACAPSSDPSEGASSEVVAQSSQLAANAYNCTAFNGLGGSTKVDLGAGKVCESAGPATDPGFCTSSLANVYPIVRVRDGAITQDGATIAFKEVYAEKEGKIVYLKIFAPALGDPNAGQAERIHHADILSDTSGPRMFATSATAPFVDGDGACYEL